MDYLKDIYDLLLRKLASWFEGFVEMLPNYLLATLVLLLFIILSRVFRKVTLKILGRTSNNHAINNFISLLTSIMVILFGIFIALDIVRLDKMFTSLLAGAGILGLAFSLGFQDVVSNFVASFMIATRKPYVIGNLIESNGVLGRVHKINMRSTYIHTPEGQTVVIPNRMIYQNPMTNYSTSGNRRVDLQVSVSYNEDLRKVKEITIAAINKIDMLLDGNDVEFYYEKFDDYSIALVVRYWIPFSKQKEYKQAVSDGIMYIKEAYDEHGIVIPFPIRTLSTEPGVSFQIEHVAKNTKKTDD